VAELLLPFLRQLTHIELTRLERELNWSYAELGYVRRDSNVTAPPAAGPAAAIDRQSVSAESEILFKDMALDQSRLSLINQLVDRIAAAKDRYETVQANTGVPWFVVGILHQLEVNGSFSTHLNGDSLSARTVHVPVGRPSTGQPPFEWVDSATDLLKDIFRGARDFGTVGNVIYEFERYNGFGYRRRNVRSPFVWACTDQYISGRYVSDAIFDPNAKIAQCGVAAILRVLMDRKLIVI